MKRYQEETFEQYRARIKLMNLNHRQWIKGRVIWDSKPEGMKKGITYINPFPNKEGMTAIPLDFIRRVLN